MRMTLMPLSRPLGTDSPTRPSGAALPEEHRATVGRSIGPLQPDREDPTDPLWTTRGRGPATRRQQLWRRCVDSCGQPALLIGGHAQRPAQTGVHGMWRTSSPGLCACPQARPAPQRPSTWPRLTGPRPTRRSSRGCAAPRPPPRRARPSRRRATGSPTQGTTRTAAPRPPQRSHQPCLPQLL